MNKLEKIDIYNENKEKTGKIKIRYKDILEKNEYIVGVQAIIINSKNEILISKRSKDAPIYPLMWECNGGAISVNENNITGVLREVREELGIEFKEKDAIFYKTVKKENLFKDIFIFKKDIDIINIKFQDNEAVAAKWVSIDEFMQMYKNNEIVPNVDFDRKGHKECIEILKNKKI